MLGGIKLSDLTLSGFYGSLTEFKNQAYAITGGSTLAHLKQFFKSEYTRAVGLVENQKIRINAISDPTLKAAMLIEYDGVAKKIPFYQTALITNADAITDATVGGVFSAFDSWREKVSDLVIAVQEVPGTIGLAASSADIARQAESLITPEEMEQIRLEGGDSENYFRLLYENLRLSKMADVMKQYISPAASSVIDAQAAAAKQGMNEMKSTEVAIDTISDNNPVVKAALDAGDKGFMGMMNSFIDMAKSPFKMIGPQWTMAVLGVAGLGALMYGAKIAGVFGTISKQKTKRAKIKSKEKMALVAANPHRLLILHNPCHGKRKRKKK